MSTVIGDLISIAILIFVASAVVHEACTHYWDKKTSCSKQESYERQLTVTHRDEPIIAYKWAVIGYKWAEIGYHLASWADHMELMVDPARLYGQFTVRGIVQSEHYRPADIAKCGALGEHLAPSPGCSCGFYAVSRERLQEVSDWREGSVVLKVALYGRVIRHQWGYRAERQRVLGVHLNPLCLFCKRECRRLVVHDGMVVSACEHCGNREFQIEPKELSNEWRVEVRWGNIRYIERPDEGEPEGLPPV
jgi:hypothetical protein